MSLELSLRRPDCDVLIIGGGVNGTGVARDLALRGLKTLLVERNDLAFGASGNSSGMLHGGARYLTTHPSVTRTSCLDSGYVQRIAPHMIFRIPFLYPVYGKTAAAWILAEAIDSFFSLYDDFQALKRGKRHARLSPDEVRVLVPGIRTDRLIAGMTFDEWGINAARLCVANALDAVEHHGSVRVHTTVEKILVENGEVVGATVRDRLTGSVTTLTARAIVNATGAWSPITSDSAGLSTRVKVRPGKGIHLVLDRMLSDIAVLCNTIDGRVIMVYPWENTTYIGTTDDDTYADLDDLPVTTDEVRYLLEGIESVLPRVRDARVVGTTVGARPTLYEYGPNEDELSREHLVMDHSSDGARGLYSLLGGKLASYRLFSEEASDVVSRALGVSARCSTHTSPLPGGDKLVDPTKLASKFKIDPYAALGLVRRHGTRAEVVLGESGVSGRRTVCLCEPVLACEVQYVIKHEFARTLGDVARRTNLGRGACGGTDCALGAAILAGEILGWTASEMRSAAADFVAARKKSRRPAIGPAQARAEASVMATLRSLGRP